MACLAAASCDSIDENDRLVYVKPAEVKRCVLIEDFTGQRCPNCPKAADAIVGLQEQYGSDNVIAVGIHGGNLAVYSTATVTGLRTAAGDEYYAAAGSPALPAGRVNRVGGTATRDQWQSMVYSQIQQTVPLALHASCQYTYADNKAVISVSALGIEKLSGKLQIWLVEDGITATQLMPDGKANTSYVHNHVFRAAANGTWGEDFSIAEGEIKKVECTAAIDPSWHAENMSAVVFVYNDNGVMQVTKAKIIPDMN